MSNDVKVTTTDKKVELFIDTFEFCRELVRVQYCYDKRVGLYLYTGGLSENCEEKWLAVGGEKFGNGFTLPGFSSEKEWLEFVDLVRSTVDERNKEIISIIYELEYQYLIDIPEHIRPAPTPLTIKGIEQYKKDVAQFEQEMQKQLVQNEEGRWCEPSPV